MEVSLVVCTDLHFGISREGKIPWKVPEDLAFFRALTLGTTVVMGRKTFESLGKPLSGRRNLVVSSNGEFKTLESTLQAATEKVFIIGGSSLYNEAIQKKLCDKIYLNVLHDIFDCDNFIINPENFGYRLESTDVSQVKCGLVLEKRVYTKFSAS